MIDSFIRVPGTAEIVCIGGVRQPRGEAQEVEVEVIVASDMDAPNYNSERDVSSHWLGCGQLDLLTTGSCYEGGEWKRWAPEHVVARPSSAWRKREEMGVGFHPQQRG